MCPVLEHGTCSPQPATPASPFSAGYNKIGIQDKIAKQTGPLLRLTKNNEQRCGAWTRCSPRVRTHCPGACHDLTLEKFSQAPYYV